MDSKRRSTRVPRIRYMEADSADEYVEDANENAVVEEPTHRARKKRKAREESDTAKPAKPAKRGRGKRGWLKKLVEMPVDILYEIFGQLDPLDLLHITHTTKDLRALLMSRSSISVWKSARSNIIGLPDCPDDLNEPQYANLMFVTRCSFCQKERVVHTSWYARVKSCIACLKLNFLSMPVWLDISSWANSRKYPALLANWVPFVEVRRERHRNGETSLQHRAFFIWEATDKQWASEYAALKDPQSRYEWLLRTLEPRYAIQKHARECAFWHMVRENVDAENLNEIQTAFQRRTEVMNYVQEIGYAEEIYKLPPASHNPLDSQILKNIWWSSGAVDVSDLQKLQYLCNETLVRSGRTRERREHEEFFKMRKLILSEIYEKGLDTTRRTNSPCPTLAEMYQIVEAHGLMDYSKSAADALSVPFDKVITLWQEHVDGKLLQSLKNAYGPGPTFDPAKVFDLAIAFFTCPGSGGYRTCGSPIMRHDEAMEHPCAVELGTNSPASQWAFDTVFGHSVWHDVAGRVECRGEYLKILQQVVEMSGLDPKVATARQMDELDPIFECRACNSFQKGRATMTWTAVLGHQRAVHQTSMNLDHLRILEEPIATKVRERIREEQERKTYSANGCNVVCPHCASTFVDLQKYQRHLKESHQIAKFKYEELVHSFKENRIPPVYRLWPPRGLGEDESETEDQLPSPESSW